MNHQKIKINIVINEKNIPFEVCHGDTFLDIKHCNEQLLDSFECACEGSLACSTCHVVVDKKYYPYTFENDECEPSCEESDMLDLAPQVTSTSRLGCQVRMNQNLNGATFTVPSENRNFSHKKADIA